MLHAVIHAALTYIVLQVWICWQAPLFVLLVHATIDFIKQRCKRVSATAFIVDQVVHVFSLLALTWLAVRFSWVPAFSGIGYKPFVVLAGFIATAQGAGFLVAIFTKRLIDENNLELDGLIGQLERCLIFLFIFMGQPAGIGFLVAAKSILRFEKAKEQKLAEYVLIGSLLSFSIAIALSAVTKWAMGI